MIVFLKSYQSLKNTKQRVTVANCQIKRGYAYQGGGLEWKNQNHVQK